jgi:hypothetical protein
MGEINEFAVETGSAATIYMYTMFHIGSDIQKLLLGYRETVTGK